MFNVKETVSYWKRMTSRPFMPAEKSMPGFKASEDKLTLLLRANAAGNLKSKSMLIYHSRNPRAFKNYSKPTLPVLCKWKNKA